MKNIFRSLVLGLFLAGSLGFAGTALAATPMLSVTPNGSNITITVSNADPYAVISLYQRQSTQLWTTVTNFGTTSSNGYFSTSQAAGFDNSSNPLQIYVIVDGLQSTVAQVYPNSGSCSYNCGNPYTMSLSQNSVSLTAGQSVVVTAYSSNNSGIYVSGNTNSSVATYSLSGNQITIYGSTAGSTTINVCASGYTNQCASVYVTVGSSSGSGLIFNPANPNLTVGQGSTNVLIGNSIYGAYSSGYYIYSNSNQNVVSATISNVNLVLTPLSVGTASVTICQNSTSLCGTVYVNVAAGAGYSNNTVSLYDDYYSPTAITVTPGTTVTWVNLGTMNHTVTSDNGTFSSGNLAPGASYTYTFNTTGTFAYHCQYHGGVGGVGMSGTVTVSGSGTNGSLTFSQSNVSLSQNQSTNVNIFGGSGSYFVSNNSNLYAASATVSGSTLYINALNTGSTTLTVCQNNASYICGYVYVTVNGGGSSSGSLTFSNSSPSLSLGQSIYINVYSPNGYSGNYFVSNNSNSTAVSASISGSSLYITALNSGTSTIMVCQSGYTSNCGNLYVTVGGQAGGSVSFSPSSLNLSLGQNSSVTISGTNGYNNNYTISGNTNPQVASAYISGNVMYISGTNTGNTTFNVCQNGYAYNCGSLIVTVGNIYNNGSLYFMSTSLPQMLVGQYFNYQFQTSGGSGNYTYSLIGGSTPIGLTMSSTGGLYGTPTYASSYSFTIQVSDNYGRTATQNFSGSVWGMPMSTSSYTNGTLISENGTIYIVYHSTKTGFTNSPAFLGLGFNFGNVASVGNSGLASSGQVVTTQFGPHPWGTWIKSGQTVYMVHQSGLIPVPDWNTFLNNGGQANMIVNANNYDFQMPILSAMTYSDSRLQ